MHGSSTTQSATSNQQSREFCQRWLIRARRTTGTPFARFNLNGKPTMGLYPTKTSSRIAQSLGGLKYYKHTYNGNWEHDLCDIAIRFLVKDHKGYYIRYVTLSTCCSVRMWKELKKFYFLFLDAQFLPCDAMRCTVLVIVILSVRPSVRLSVTLVHCVHMV